jgi:prevent-host-death family protein
MLIRIIYMKALDRTDARSDLARSAISVRLGAIDQFVHGEHLSRLLRQVEKGETITITKRGKPIAVLSPAHKVAERDVSAVIAEFRAYSQDHARKHGSLKAHEIKEMIEEGRP